MSSLFDNIFDRREELIFGNFDHYSSVLNRILDDLRDEAECELKAKQFL